MKEHDNIHLFEEHSSTLPIWWQQHSPARTVVYLDAHLDLQKTSAASLAALRACTSIEQVLDLEAPTHLNPSARYAFGIENFLHPAHELGLIKRLVWVSPPHIPRRYSSALIDYMQQMDGIEFEELTGFHATGGNTMRGRLMGLDITICDYDELQTLDLDEDYSLDIDIDYFVEVPSDRLWIDPATVVNSITTQLGAPSLVTISRAVSSGFTPLVYRFVGDYLYSLLNNRQTEFAGYQKLVEVIGHLDVGNREDGRRICQRLVEANSGLAAAHYLLALASEGPQQKKELLQAAAKLDPGYGFDLAREAIGLLHRKKPFNPDVLRQLVQALANSNLEPLQRQQAEVALAQVLAASGAGSRAQSLLARQSGDYANHDDVLLSIVAGQLTEDDKQLENERLLRTIAGSAKNGTTATLYLGDLAFARQHYEEALQHYAVAHDRARAWMIPLERMLASYRKLGLDDEADLVGREIATRQKRLQTLVAQS